MIVRRATSQDRRTVLGVAKANCLNDGQVSALAGFLRQVPTYVAVDGEKVVSSLSAAVFSYKNADDCLLEIHNMLGTEVPKELHYIAHVQTTEDYAREGLTVRVVLCGACGPIHDMGLSCMKLPRKLDA